jgi:AraC family transcriptional regulator of adaptative response / DNA-3-methyladenine glycosylase II
MLEKMLASDSAYNGRFITGVLTTGIYCLPSCHARKPKPENVQFFKTGREARKAGLRPCKLCKPDEFEQGIDTELDLLEQVAEAMRTEPGSFATVDDAAVRACVSVSTLHQQFRVHFHASPGTYLLRCRIDAARRRLLRVSDDAAEVGSWAGFDSTSGFYDSFKRFTGMTPAAYRALPSRLDFQLALPEGYNLPMLFSMLGRDPQSVSERLNGDTYEVAYSIESRAQLLRLRFDGLRVFCELLGDHPVEAHKTALRILNLRQDPSSFERLALERGFARLINGREGMRITLTPTLFEGIVWVIVGQQVNFRFAGALRARLTGLVGVPIQDRFCMPEPKAIAKLDPSDLLKLQFSRQKADYLISCARRIAEGDLSLESLSSGSATAASQELLAVRGLGIWSVNYLMMRAMGFSDCVPLGDTGIRSGVRSLFDLDHEPKPAEVETMLKPFSPYRSLACAHIWRGGASLEA